MPPRLRLVATALPFVLLAAACGGDDGADVRSSGTGSASGSGSGTHASGTHASGSGSATGHASGTGVAECAPVGSALEAEAAREVGVALGEWFVRPERDRVKRGVVTFAVQNEGEDAHGFVVVRGSSAGDLPVAADGTVDLAALGDDFIGEVEAFPAGDSCTGTFRLAKGSYVLLCNLLHDEDGEAENHFELGMHAEFTVS